MNTRGTFHLPSHRSSRWQFGLTVILFFLLTSCGVSASQQLAISAQTPLSTQGTATVPSLLYYQTNDSIYGVDAVSGKIHWSATFAPFITSRSTHLTYNQATVSNGMVYAEATGNDGYYIYAYDAFRGTLRWKYRYGGDELQGEDVDTPSKVLVGQEVVYLVAGTDPLASVGPQYPQDNTQENPIPPVSTILYKLDAATGHVLWRHPLSYRFNMPVLVGNTLYGIGNTIYHGSLEALNANDGSLIWQHQLPQSDAHYANLTFNNGVLYAMTLNFDGTLSLFAFSASNGQRLWQSSEKIAGSSVSDFGIGFHTLYFAADSDHVYAVSKQDGKLLWQRTFSAFLDSSNLFISNNLLYLSTQSLPDPSPLTLYTLDGLSGVSHWTHPLSSGNATFSQIEIHQNLLYVVTLDDTQGPVRMSRYDSASGNLIGTYLLPSSVSMPTVPGKVTLNL